VRHTPHEENQVTRPQPQRTHQGSIIKTTNVKQGNRKENSVMVELPIPCNFHLSRLQKKPFNTPYLVKTFEKSFGKEGANIDILNDPSPNILGTHDDLVSNEVLDR
jgi:hypothetical protein